MPNLRQVEQAIDQGVALNQALLEAREWDLSDRGREILASGFEMQRDGSAMLEHVRACLEEGDLSPCTRSEIQANWKGGRQLLRAAADNLQLALRQG